MASRTPAATSGSVTLSARSVASAPGDRTVVRMLYGLTSMRRPPRSRARRSSWPHKQRFRSHLVPGDRGHVDDVAALLAIM